MSRIFYEKVNGKCVQVGYEFAGFPSNGTWLVQDGKQNCIIPIEGVPEFPSPSLISYMKYQEELQIKISKAWEDNALSVRDISQIACEFFAEKAVQKDVHDIFEF